MRRSAVGLSWPLLHGGELRRNPLETCVEQPCLNAAACVALIVPVAVCTGHVSACVCVVCVCVCVCACVCVCVCVCV
jgi:hypothetical protein